MDCGLGLVLSYKLKNSHFSNRKNKLILSHNENICEYRDKSNNNMITIYTLVFTRERKIESVRK